MERRRYDPYDSYPQHAASTRDPPPRPSAKSSAGNDSQPMRKTAALSQADSRAADPYQHARHDSRYQYPPSPIAERPRPSQPSPSARRRSWPPQPSVEDELVSLSREFGADGLLQTVAQDQAPYRGTVDQEPLIIDVPELLNQHERRFILKEQIPSETGIPTPPASEDERRSKARRKLSELNAEDEAYVPDLSKRTASPYAYTKPSKPRGDVSSSDRDTLNQSYSTSSSYKNGRSASNSNPVSLGRDSVRRSRGDYFESHYNHDDSAIDDSPPESKPYYPAGKRMAESPRISSVDTGSLTASAPPIRKLNLDARRNTDSQNTLPALGRLNIDRSRRPTALMASSSLGEARDTSPLLDLPSTNGYTRSRESSYASSRGPSPVGSTHNSATSPSRSPRCSAEFPQDGSAHGSRPPSASNSRPASPSPRTPMESSRIARSDLDWGTLLAANAARRAKPPSKLTVPLQYETPPDHAPSASSLPYPEDHTLMGSSISMPEEQDHAYYPTKYSAMPLPEVHMGTNSASSISPAPSTSSRSSARSTTRPLLARGYSANTVATAEPRSAESRHPRPFELRRAESFATTSDARKELSALMKKGLPPCSRPEPVAGYDDWYTVSGATNIDICPECILFFERTIFRSHFRRSLPRSLNDEVWCAFGSPWIRLAWLLTLQQHRTDLSLLRDLAEIEETTDPCPGATQTVRSWYGLRDPDGLFVRDFHVCFGDVRKIERLLPSLAGMLMRLPPRASSEKQTCAIRTDSNRFSAYLDALVSTHEKAVMSRKGADPMLLVDLVERKTRLPECTRDNMLIGGLWHFNPDIPSLTVCEDCFESVVEPEIKKGSSVAKKFNRTIQPVYGEGIGSSCQLYSRRMRKVFERAVEESDLKYLSRKAKERREMELYLQDKYKEITRKAKRLSMEGPVSEEDKRRLTKDLDKISNEWKSKWE